MRTILSFVLFFCLSGLSFAQSTESFTNSLDTVNHANSLDTGDLTNSFDANLEYTSSDSVPRKSQTRLLPQSMSLMERGLWGESGLFRSIGIADSLSPQARQHEMNVRRTMLTAHEIGGFVTFGLLATTVFYGQRMLNNHFDQYDQEKHNTFESLAILSYCTTALLSILSPPPLIRRDEVSTTSIHKLLAWIHVSGMILTPIIGSRIKSRQASIIPGGRGQTTYNIDTAHFHQVSAYVTTTIFGASMVIILF
jgi:hypothetical protein